MKEQTMQVEIPYHLNAHDQMECCFIPFKVRFFVEDGFANLIGFEIEDSLLATAFLDLEPYEHSDILDRLREKVRSHVEMDQH